MQAPESPQKVYDENETKKQSKNNTHVKMFWWREGDYRTRAYRKLMPWISTSFKSMIVDTMQVLFV